MPGSVVVAGGLGDLGKLITEAILKTGQHDVYIMSRKLAPIIQTDYASETAVAELLIQHNCHTVICAFALDFEAASDAQLRLIRAAARAPCVRRFLPSEFNVDYDLPDAVLPYADKRFHAAARRALEQTDLEFAYIYPGMFMDYFGMPRVATHLRELSVFVDPTHGVALLPGDGETRMAASYTKDVARYTALALALDRWPRVMTTASSSVTLNELVALVGKSRGSKLRVEYQSVGALQDRTDARVLPRNELIAGHFPGGVQQLSALLADLGASVALGAYDFSKLEGQLDLVARFAGETEQPMKIETLLDMAWGGSAKTSPEEGSTDKPIFETDQCAASRPANFPATPAPAGPSPGAPTLLPVSSARSLYCVFQADAGRPASTQHSPSGAPDPFRRLEPPDTSRDWHPDPGRPGPWLGGPAPCSAILAAPR
ncbi:NAD(P)-binding domain [Cordyceps militaris]|uniref:NAD(P)-binding domain n=1 Tax=Cordyceps militaris TaxID=73501 RepID=A0A2H4ST85_CORMI|nr:NAD(P)-binding domain [Cordyceps militaris]